MKDTENALGAVEAHTMEDKPSKHSERSAGGKNLRKENNGSVILRIRP
jgi:hypothetical protein